MRNTLILAASVASATFMIAGMEMAHGAVAQQISAPVAVAGYDRAPWWMKENVITQTGSVFSEVPANRANFSADFLSVDDTEAKAQAKAIAATRALSQALDKLGKDAVRVTTSFSMRALYEEYRDKNGNRIEDQRADKINGYQVSLDLSLEVRDMSVLEKAYALVLAASPTSTTNISFSLQPSNEMNTWIYTQAVKDARVRAEQAVEAAGGHLGAIKVIDPTGRACQTDILARAADGGPDGITAQDAGAFPDKSVGEALHRVAGVAVDRFSAPPPPPAAMRDEEVLEDKALNNPFVQTPPLQRLDQTACVVYGVQ